ncbi:uncharacterized protein [Setaria viridis]|uniref:uncharacterized protein n=1 Tax=Setaria viridis TaxID=4556 RepID=UPI001493AB1B|nr:translation initiation factor IF-2-like [Setaria viridis]
MVLLQPCELLGIVACLLGSSLELLEIEASLLDDGLELVLCPPPVLPRRLLTPAQVVDDLLSGGDLRGQLPDPLPLHGEAIPEPPLKPEEIRLPSAALLEGLQNNLCSATERREENNHRGEHRTWPPGTTKPCSSPIAEDRAARTFAILPCTAYHLPHSSTSFSTKRGLCGSYQDAQRRVGPPHALGTRLTGTRVEAVLADPGAAVPNAAARAGATAPDAAGLVDGPGTCAAVSVEVATAVLDADARPAPSAAATVSVAAVGASIPVPAAAAGAGTPASTAAAVPVAAAEADFPSSIATAISIAVTGTPAPISAAAISTVTARAAGSSSTSSSRSITSSVGGTPGATPCPAGRPRREKAEQGSDPAPCPAAALFLRLPPWRPPSR